MKSGKALVLVAMQLGLSVGCGPASEDRAGADGGACGRAAAHASECLGFQISESELACSSDADVATANQISDTSCEDLAGLLDASGKGDGACPKMAESLKLCKPARPALPCESALGKEVASAIWNSNHRHGTVPTEWLQTSRNAAVATWVDAPEIFQGMADLIAEARYEADLETFEWDPWVYDQTQKWTHDSTMLLVDGVKRLQSRLEAEEAQGGNPHLPVTVRFVINGPHRKHPQGGNFAVNKARKLLLQLQNADIDRRLVDVRVGAHEYLVWGALHSKMLVVDGYKAVVTGANPQKFNTIGNHWHDTAYLVHGEAGRALQHDFDGVWDRSSEVESCSFADMAAPAECKLVSTKRPDHVPQVDEPNFDSLGELDGACLPMWAASRLPYSLAWGNPMTPNNPQDAAFIAMLDHAQQVMKIESPNLNAALAKQKLVDAVKSGTEVRLILSLGFNSYAERQKVAGIDAGGSNEDVVLALYQALGDPGLCDKLKIRWNAKQGKPTWVQEPGASHTKYMSVDGQLAMVGSANQDTVS